MQVSPIKWGIIGMLLIGGVVVLVTIFSAMGSGDRDSLEAYARGEMRSFVSIGDPPAQPDIIYQDASGNDLTLADYRGKVILVNFWATWCGPCVEEMPALDALAGDMNGEEFEVVTISLDRSLEDARLFYEQLDIRHLPLIHDSTLASPGQVGAIGLPMTILYDRYGREVGRLPAPAHWDSEDARNLIAVALRQT